MLGVEGRGGRSFRNVGREHGYSRIKLARQDSSNGGDATIQVVHHIERGLTGSNFGG